MGACRSAESTGDISGLDDIRSMTSCTMGILLEFSAIAVVTLMDEVAPEAEWLTIGTRCHVPSRLP